MSFIWKWVLHSNSKRWRLLNVCSKITLVYLKRQLLDYGRYKTHVIITIPRNLSIYLLYSCVSVFLTVNLIFISISFNLKPNLIRYYFSLFSCIFKDDNKFNFIVAFHYVFIETKVWLCPMLYRTIKIDLLILLKLQSK